MKGTAIIVGGSLTGLATAIALAHIGVEVTLIERGVGLERGGTGLGVDRDLLSHLVGVDARSSGLVGALPVVRSRRETSTWFAICNWLRDLAFQTTGLSIREGLAVTRVTQDSLHATAWTGDEAFSADVVLGADGYRSVVRTAVDPEHSESRYGGFVLWRSMVQESVLPRRFQMSSGLGSGVSPDARAARLVAYQVPGIDGSSAIGERLITLAWYDASRSAWLRQNGYIDNGAVIRSVASRDIDSEFRDDLRAVANSAWSAPARDIALSALDGENFFGTPLAEYYPHRLVHERIAILGDAAHVASPMVGHGLALGWLDGIALREAVEDHGHIGPDALRIFERMRLPESQSHVSASMSMTEQFLASTDHALKAQLLRNDLAMGTLTRRP